MGDGLDGGAAGGAHLTLEARQQRDDDVHPELAAVPDGQTRSHDVTHSQRANGTQSSAKSETTELTRHKLQTSEISGS